MVNMKCMLVFEFKIQAQRMAWEHCSCNFVYNKKAYTQVVPQMGE